ncbi:unnamed protein product [Schistosoma curassoni]|uniref:Transmembrane protein n=1 Tax=Schistosoma curassoni TaxID=6186 RepID=A0A183K065_9TREM|nr:unnamed protein product [Schistosoma curassoni]
MKKIFEKEISKALICLNLFIEKQCRDYFKCFLIIVLLFYNMHFLFCACLKVLDELCYIYVEMYCDKKSTFNIYQLSILKVISRHTHSMHICQ